MRRGLGRRSRPHGTLLLCGILAACDPSIGVEDGPTLLRFVNTAPDASGPLRFVLTGGPGAVLQRGDESDYAEVTPRSYALTIEDDVAKWAFTSSVRVTEGLMQTMYAFGNASDEAAILVGDEPTLPGAGRALLRILHLASATGGAADAHVVQAGQAIEPGTAVATEMTFPSERIYLFIGAGTHRVVFTVSGTTANVIVDSGPLEFASGAVYTAVLLNDAAGAAELIRLRDGV
jgi:hypothetical protein